MNIKKNWVLIFLDDERGICSGKLTGGGITQICYFIKTPKIFVCKQKQRNNCQVCFKL